MALHDIKTLPELIIHYAKTIGFGVIVGTYLGYKTSEYFFNEKVEKNAAKNYGVVESVIPDIYRKLDNLEHKLEEKLK